MVADMRGLRKPVGVLVGPDMGGVLGSAANVGSDMRGQSSTPALLDLYSGAVAGFSFARKLKSSATLALRALRAGPTTQEIGFSGDDIDTAAILRFSAGVELTANRLYDQTGSGAYLEPTGTSPIIATTSGLVTDAVGNPAANFASTPLISNSSTWTTTNGLNGNITVTVFIVAKKTTAGSGHSWGLGDGGTGLGIIGQYDDNSAPQIAFSGGNPANVSSIANNTQFLTTILKTPGAISSTTTAWRNGSVVTLGTGSGSTPNILPGYLAIGRWVSGFFFTGQIQEFIVFAGDKSSDRAAIESDIRAYYGF